MLLPSITKPIFCGTLCTLYTLVLVMISECKLNLLFPLSQLPLVKFGKFQCPSWTEFPKFSGTPLTFYPYVILKVVIANQRSIFGRPVLLHGTVCQLSRKIQNASWQVWTWQPARSLTEIWRRNKRKTWKPSALQIFPSIRKWISQAECKI